MTIKRLGLTLIGILALACTDGTGLGDPAPLSVHLQLSGTPTAGPSFEVAGARAAGAVVTLADVDSLNARVTRVEALPRAHQPDSADGGAWQSVAVSGNGLINLVKLPTQGALVVAADSVPSGDYVNLRFFTLANLAVTGTGAVVLAPVLTQK